MSFWIWGQVFHKVVNLLYFKLHFQRFLKKKKILKETRNLFLKEIILREIDSLYM